MVAKPVCVGLWWRACSDPANPLVPEGLVLRTKKLSNLVRWKKVLLVRFITHEGTASQTPN